MFFKILSFILYFSGIIITYIFSPYVFLWIILSIIISILYNNKTISSKNKPPIDTIFHFLGCFCFSNAGGLWDGNSLIEVLIISISFSFLFTGGYWNHLLLDKERDKSMGLRTLTLRIAPKIIKFGSIFMICLGDIILAFYLGRFFSIFWFVSGVVIFTTFFSGLKVKDPKSYRKMYRKIHLLFSILIFIYFSGFFT